MVQYIKQGDIFGRIGSGIGKGIADQLPQEIERGRLAAGLQNLSQQNNLTPFQQFAGLASTPGATPQIIQSGTDLLRQEARGRALANQKSAGVPKFPQSQSQMQGAPSSQVPSITKGELVEQIQEGWTPRTEDEKFASAGQKFNANPAFYGNDPQKAIDMENQIDSTNEKRFLATEAQNQRLSNIQDNVVRRLKDQSERLQAKVPSNLYSQIEDKAIKATKPRKDGGRGLSEQEAIKEYGKELDDLSRDFDTIKRVGNWGITLRPAKESLRSLKDIQRKMEEAGATDEFAQTLINENKLSPIMAFSIAERVSRVPGLNQELRNLKPLEFVHGAFESKVPPNISVPKTLEVAPRLAEYVKNNEKASPLAIAHELQKKGYDAETWLQYLTDHASELNLRKRQSEQSSNPQNVLPTWNDWWLKAFSGIE